MKRRQVVHRSFSIDGDLVDQVRRVVPAEVAGNLNRIVTVALTELVLKYQRAAFDDQIAKMASDPAVGRECREATADFEPADADGL